MSCVRWEYVGACVIVCIYYTVFLHMLCVGSHNMGYMITALVSVLQKYCTSSFLSLYQRRFLLYFCQVTIGPDFWMCCNVQS